MPANQCTAQDLLHSSVDFSSTVCDVPQLNQMRTKCAASVIDPLSASCLPAPNEWCAPTATMDLLAAFADRGALTAPAKKDWSLPANYKELTRDLYRLGTLMGTSSKGTTGSGDTTGVNAWLADKQTQPGDLVFSSFAAPAWNAGPDEGTVGPEQMLLRLADNQWADGLNTAGLGFCDNATPSPNDNPKTTFSPPANPTSSGPFNSRDAFGYGGHVVAVTGVSLGPAGATLAIHDPAQPFAGLTQQTPYETDTYHLKFSELRTWAPVPGNPWASGKTAGNGQGTQTSDTATMALEGYWVPGVVSPGTNEATYIDGFGELTPSSVAFPQTNSSIALISDPKAHYREDIYKVAGGVTHLALDPLDPALIYYTAAGSDTIRVLNVRDRRSRILATASAPVLQLVPGGAEDGVYALTAHTVVSFNPRGHKVGVVHGTASPFGKIRIHGELAVTQTFNNLPPTKLFDTPL